MSLAGKSMQILDLPIPLTVFKETHRFYFVIPFKKN